MKKMLGLLLCFSICVASFPGESIAEAAPSDKVIGSPKLAVLVDGRKVKFQGETLYLKMGEYKCRSGGLAKRLARK